MFPVKEFPNTANGKKMALEELKTRRVRVEYEALEFGWHSVGSPTWSDIDLLFSLLGEKTGLFTKWDPKEEVEIPIKK